MEVAVTYYSMASVMSFRLVSAWSYPSRALVGQAWLANVLLLPVAFAFFPMVLIVVIIPNVSRAFAAVGSAAKAIALRIPAPPVTFLLPLAPVPISPSALPRVVFALLDFVMA